ncbi:hypothetical protein [Haliangium sp. UPWRP_2]|uniref:hypothetical protein n=1 Tax=Haliangium sp. UPWRP_2 TaxID=1931276 RepID=UPI001E43A9A6|nr:hypothetical protein [Haliangium sp. UPWRP_2]PSM31427.1 hypothetical protein BVG81_005485 [Haliangium sp. UPWRP_2]
MIHRYLWELKTQNGGYPAAPGTLTLSLHGSNGVTEPVKLEQALTDRDLAQGIIEADEDIGNLVTGSLASTLESPQNWEVDFVRVTRLRDGVAWIASEVGTCTEQGCPLLRFDRVNVYPTVPADDSEPAPGTTNDAPPRNSPLSKAHLQRRIVQLKNQLDELQRLGNPRQAEVIRQIAERVQPLIPELLRASDDDEARPDADSTREPNPSADTQASAEPVVIEIFGQVRGQNTQLSSILRKHGSRLALVPEARVFVTQDESEGFRISRKGPRASPYGAARFSLGKANFDVVALDGFAVKRVPVEVLIGLFGAEWPKVVLGDSA